MSDRSRSLVAALAFGAILIAPCAADAHHSTAMFEWGKSVKMADVTVERWDWTNPHTFLYVTTAGGEHWAFEGMSPSHLGRVGWSKRTLTPGQKISLTYYPLKDGRKGGFNVQVTLPDGQSIQQLPVRSDSAAAAAQ